MTTETTSSAWNDLSPDQQRAALADAEARGLYREYRQVHGASPERARAMVELEIMEAQRVDVDAILAEVAASGAGLPANLDDLPL